MNLNNNAYCLLFFYLFVCLLFLKQGDDRVLKISQKKFCASGPHNGKIVVVFFFLIVNIVL